MWAQEILCICFVLLRKKRKLHHEWPHSSKHANDQGTCFCISPWTLSSSPGEDAVNTALWKLIPSLGLAPFHQGSWRFMSTTADRGTICLRQFLSGRLFFLPRTHTVLCMKSYRLFSQQSGGFYRWPLQVKSCHRSQTTMQTFNMMDGAG